MSRMKFCFEILVLIALCCGCDLKFQESKSIIFDEKAIQLTKDHRRKSDPAWSPDGSMIAYSYFGISTTFNTSSLDGTTVTEIGQIGEDLRNRRFAISPDGSKIVYRSDSRGHLWVVNLQNGDEFLLTPDHQFAFDPAWSADGQMIAFSAVESGSSGRYIWTIPSSGGSARQITNSGNRAILPSWSPDNKKIAFESSGNEARIWIVDIDTGVETALTPDSTRSRAPDWSPDGSTLAYFSDQNGREDIWLIPAEGGDATQLTHSIDAVNPSWSPDGTKIAYRTADGVWVSSGSGELLHRTDLRESYPTWLPDSQLLIGTVMNGFSNIQVYVLDDSLIMPVTEQVNGRFDVEPAWYPNSDKIVFVRRGEGLFRIQTLWVKPIFGGAAQPLVGAADRESFEANPDISPDGRWLVYDNGFKIFLISLPNGSAIDLSPFIGTALSEPDWAPDSQGIICNNRASLKIFTTDSSLVVEDRVIPGSFSEPVWSAPHPVFGSNIAATGYDGIFVMRPDGSDRNLVISGARQPTWSPDGSRLAFLKNNQVFVSSVFIELQND